VLGAGEGASREIGISRIDNHRVLKASIRGMMYFTKPKTWTVDSGSWYDCVVPSGSELLEK
jgi:hypothetical protein